MASQSQQLSPSRGGMSGTGAGEVGGGGSEPPGVGFDKLCPPASSAPGSIGAESPWGALGQTPPSLLGFSKWPRVGARFLRA